MSTTTSACLEPRITACPCRIIMSSVTGTVVSKPCITLPSELPTRMTSQKRSTRSARMRVIRGEHHDRLAILAGADIGRGHALDGGLHGHGR